MNHRISIKDKMHVLLKMCMILLCAAVGVTLLLVIVYCIPTERMAQNVLDSRDALSAQDDEKILRESGFYNYYDTGTNIIILHEVIYPNTGHVLRDALLAPAADYFNGNLDQWIATLMEHAQTRIYGNNDFQTYGRYWHGYLVFLKPLFVLFNLEQIYIINTVVLLLLVVGVCYNLYKKMGKVVWAYLMFVVMMNPWHIVQSFQLSAVFYALNITMYLLLRHYEKWRGNRIYYLFLLDGMLVAFLDFLTYPMVALAVPLLTFILLEKSYNWKKQLKLIFENTVSFTIGYGGFWLLKWIVASLFTDENILKDGIGNVLHRVGAQEMSEDVLFDDSIGAALKVNIETICNRQTLFVVLIFIVVFCVFLYHGKVNISKVKNYMVAYVVVGLSPFIWIVFAHNHCALHPHLEWRELAILFYVLSVGLLEALEQKGREKKNE